MGRLHGHVRHNRQVVINNDSMYSNVGNHNNNGSMDKGGAKMSEKLMDAIALSCVVYAAIIMVVGITACILGVI